MTCVFFLHNDFTVSLISLYIIHIFDFKGKLNIIFNFLGVQGGNVGLVISQVMGLVTILQYALRISTQMENEMISVER